jgi:hypothetical protein
VIGRRRLRDDEFCVDEPPFAEIAAVIETCARDLAERLLGERFRLAVEQDAEFAWRKPFYET